MYNSAHKSFYNTALPYMTVASDKSYYAEPLRWDGSIKIAPYQIGPIIKNVVASGLTTIGAYEVFQTITMELDYSNFDFNHVYASSLTVKTLTDGSVLVEGTPLSPEDAKKRALGYVSMTRTTTAGNQTSSSQSIQASQTAPTVTLYTPYVGSTIAVYNRSSIDFFQMGTIYTLEKDASTSQYVLKKTTSYPILPDLTVTVNR